MHVPVQVNHGHMEVDQSALTGESMAVSMTSGSELKMGSTVVGGEAEATVVVSVVAG